MKLCKYYILNSFLSQIYIEEWESVFRKIILFKFVNDLSLVI